MLSEFSYLEEIGHEKGDLIKGLQLIQQKEGYVSDDAVRAVAENFGMSPAEVEGVLTFYAQFKRVKPGRFQISSCDGTACHVKGSTTILDALYEKLNIKPRSFSSGSQPNSVSKTAKRTKRGDSPSRPSPASAAAVSPPSWPSTAACTASWTAKISSKS